VRGQCVLIFLLVGASLRSEELEGLDDLLRRPARFGRSDQVLVCSRETRSPLDGPADGCGRHYHEADAPSHPGTSVLGGLHFPEGLRLAKAPYPGEQAFQPRRPRSPPPPSEVKNGDGTRAGGDAPDHHARPSGVVARKDYCPECRIAGRVSPSLSFARPSRERSESRRR